MNVVQHPNYLEAPRVADIAVATLNFVLPLSPTIDILYLPPQRTYIPDGSQMRIVCWGFESVSHVYYFYDTRYATSFQVSFKLGRFKKDVLYKMLATFFILTCVIFELLVF